MSEPFRVVPLANSLSIHCFDQTNRYFGDYHRVCVLLVIDIPGENAALVPARFERTLERMGVAGDAVASVRESLIADFLQTSKRYLEQPDFARQYQLRQQGKRNRSGYSLPHQD